MNGSRVRIALAALVALTMAPLAVGCAALETGGTSSASCVFAVDYDDRVYLDAGKVDHTLGAEVGTARDSVCDDTGGGEGDQVPAEDLTVYAAYAIKGIDSKDAIAVRESPGDEVRVVIHAIEDEGLKVAVERIFGKDERAGGGDGKDKDDQSGKGEDNDMVHEPGGGGGDGDGRRGRRRGRPRRGARRRCRRRRS